MLHEMLPFGLQFDNTPVTRGEGCDLPPQKWTGLSRSAFGLGGADSPVTSAGDGDCRSPRCIRPGLAALGLGWRRRVMDAFGLEGVEEASMGAFSQQSPLRLIDGVMPDRARDER